MATYRIVYDLYEVRARSRATHDWITLGKRQSKWVPKAIQPKWWQFWKSRYETIEPDDLAHLDTIFDQAVQDPAYLDIQLVGYLTWVEQGTTSLAPEIIRWHIHQHVR